MPRYYPIRRWRNAATRERTIERLLALRRQLHEEVASQRKPGSFFLATWNIRDFDSNKFGHGRRLPESFHYLAEIIAAFDLVAVQEVNRDLSGLDRLMGVLGGSWDYIVTDTTEGPGGNEERMAFLFDRNKISFRNIAGEIVLPQGQEVLARKKKADEEISDRLQFARTPFMVAFQAGWFKFNLCTVHIYYGAASGAKLDRRIDEIRSIAKFFAKRQEREQEDYILLGDFNVVDSEHETMQQLIAEGFTVPPALASLATNLGRSHHYDQIALRTREKRLEIGTGGVFDYRKSVFRDEDQAAYFDQMPESKRDGDGSDAGRQKYYCDQWRSWQISDHLLLWVELKVDFTDAYLNSLKPGATPL